MAEDPEDAEVVPVIPTAPAPLQAHRWKPGQSGNPLGRNVAKAKTLSEYVRTLNEGDTSQPHRILWTIFQISQDAKVKTADRLRACEILLDRGYGKAVDVQILAQINGQSKHADSVAQLSTRALELLAGLPVGAAPVSDAQSASTEQNPLLPPDDTKPSE